MLSYTNSDMISTYSRRSLLILFYRVNCNTFLTGCAQIGSYVTLINAKLRHHEKSNVLQMPCRPTQPKGSTYHTFYDNTTAQGFFPKITRPTRSFGNSHTLIDNVFTNNLCKRHTSGILTHQISDHFITFSIVDGNIKHKNDHIKYVEVQNISSSSIANFKNAIAKSDLLSHLDLNHNAEPNQNYNILSSSLGNAKNKHIPKKLQRFNRRKHFIEPWMNKNLLALVNKKNDKYRDWKTTNNDIEYEIKKINLLLRKL